MDCKNDFNVKLVVRSSIFLEILCNSFLFNLNLISVNDFEGNSLKTFEIDKFCFGKYYLLDKQEQQFSEEYIERNNQFHTVLSVT